MILIVMIGFLTYALFELFRVETGLQAGIALCRLVFVCDLLIGILTQNPLILGGTVLLSTGIVLGAMSIMRKDLQFDDDSQ